jgi:hypothetical protein
VLHHGTDLGEDEFGALRVDPGILELDRQFAVDLLEPDLVGTGDLGQAAAPRLLLTQDNPAIHHVARPGIADLAYRYLEPELAAQLDLEISHMTRTIDPPRRRGDPDRRDERQEEEGQRRQTLARRAIQGKHPCLPGDPHDQSARWLRSGSIRPRKIVEMHVSLNQSL